MTAADVPTDDLMAGLRRYAEGELTVTAAVELLIAHAHWLDRVPFRRLVDWAPASDEGPAYAYPDWEALELLAHNPHTQPASLGPIFDTPSELGVLQVACSLAHDWLGEAITACDPVNVRLIAAAVLAAGGAR
ncbi:hypothetical protein [Pseudonocardia asaccharolytica]|uniref:Uncharacterized protein n=1 Tax=Pseudonocardia asaccharolytica DSM 44247 = NBRC 16224 TaxID=1123024 RepID=A0A511D3S6_9PSEU|nr:hypothetical protein [Pseudonocardia asaccharolytica]GEL19317.1 hypothetical protein PA7_31540 [Pseudonocardia asaccharolytica DSM 44247 = NBRC 16224]